MNFPMLQIVPRNTSGMIIVPIVAVIIVLIILANFLFSKRKTGPAGGGLFRKLAFRSKARSYGLSQPQIMLLEHTAASLHIAPPDVLLERPESLDSAMRKAVHSLEVSASVSEAEKETRKAMLFQIRQIIETEAERRDTITSTVQLAMNQELELAAKNGIRINSQVLKVQKNMFIIDMPVNGDGYEVRPQKDSELKVFFTRNGKDLYSFDTKVLGYQQNRGRLSVILQHSDRLKHEQKRRHRRKAISCPAYFFPIRIVESGTGKKMVKQAVVDTQRRLLGTIQDISAGGCAMKSLSPLPKGQLLKIEFNRGREKAVSILGKIIAVRQAQGRGSTMHIMFTRVSQKNVNIIQEYVYGFSED